jgi:hypothetical protein
MLIDTEEIGKKAAKRAERKAAAMQRVVMKPREVDLVWKA